MKLNKEYHRTINGIVKRNPGKKVFFLYERGNPESEIFFTMKDVGLNNTIRLNNLEKNKISKLKVGETTEFRNEYMDNEFIRRVR